MMRVTVAFAKNNLPKLIRQAEAGEEITILRHGKPVVQLRCLPAELRPKQDDALDDDEFNELLCPAYLKNILHS
jgi:antitoxin (DNA-binding transcriptional repressor) of toxin-antitoxin stability system